MMGVRRCVEDVMAMKHEFSSIPRVELTEWGPA